MMSRTMVSTQCASDSPAPSPILYKLYLAKIFHNTLKYPIYIILNHNYFGLTGFFFAQELVYLVILKTRSCFLQFSYVKFAWQYRLHTALMGNFLNSLT